MENHVAVWLERQKTELVKLAEEVVSQTRLHEPDSERQRRNNVERDDERTDGEPRLPAPAVSTNQIRNLLAAAQNGSPLAVLTNFLRYQRGRGRGAWEHQASFEALEKLFDQDLRSRCEQLVKVLSAAEKTLSAEQRFDAEARLAAQLLGFLTREYTYRRHVYEEEWNRDHPIARRNS